MHVTYVVAISADGKIAPVSRTKPDFGAADAAWFEAKCAEADALVMGAGTLRATGTTRSIVRPELLAARRAAGRPPQPLSVVITRSGALDSSYPFFARQRVPRAIATTRTAEAACRERHGDDADIWVCGADNVEPQAVLERLAERGMRRVVLLGGGDLAASWLAADCVDSIALTLTPLLFAGAHAPTPFDGVGLPEARRLVMQTVFVDEGCVFATYSVAPPSA